jgi:hypothetical protein
MVNGIYKLRRALSMRLVAAFRPASRTGIAQKVFNVGCNSAAYYTVSASFHTAQYAALLTPYVVPYGLIGALRSAPYGL